MRISGTPLRLIPARLATMLLAVTALAGVVAVPASAVAPSDSGQKVRYVALGDSYAFGTGATDPATQSYPALLDARAGVELTANASQPGATTADVLERQLAAAQKELKKADLVTLTVGGNDLGVGLVAQECTRIPTDPTAPVPSPACLAAVAAAEAKLASGQLEGSLLQTINEVAEAAPDAQIVVTGYPLLFEQSPDLPLGPELTALAQRINLATVALNAAIERVVQASDADRDDLVYVDVVKPFTGHGIGSTSPWIHLLGPDVFHPNAAGYLAYANAISWVLEDAEVLRQAA